MKNQQTSHQGLSNSDLENREVQNRSVTSKSKQEMNDKSFNLTKKSVVIKDTDLDQYNDFKQNAKLIVQEELKYIEQIATQPTYEQREGIDNYHSKEFNHNMSSFDFNNFINSPHANYNDTNYTTTQRNHNPNNLNNSNNQTHNNNYNNSYSAAVIPQVYSTQPHAQFSSQSRNLNQNSKGLNNNQSGQIKLSTLTQSQQLMKQNSINRQASILNEVGQQAYYNSQLNSNSNLNQNSQSQFSSNQYIPHAFSPTHKQPYVNTLSTPNIPFASRQTQQQQQQQQQQYLNQHEQQEQQYQQYNQPQKQTSTVQSQQPSIQSTNQSARGNLMQQLNNNNYASFTQGSQQQQENPQNHLQYFVSQKQQLQQYQEQNNQEMQNQQHPQPQHNYQQSRTHEDMPEFSKKDQQILQNQEVDSRYKDDSINLNFQPSQIVKIPRTKMFQDSNFLNKQELDELNKENPPKDNLHTAHSYLDGENKLNTLNQQEGQLTDRNVNLILHNESSIHSNNEESFSNNDLSIQEKGRQLIGSGNIQEKDNKNTKIQHNFMEAQKKFNPLQLVGNKVKQQHIDQKNSMQTSGSIRNLSNNNIPIKDTNQNKKTVLYKNNTLTAKQPQKSLNQSRQEDMNQSQMRVSKHYRPNLSQGVNGELNGDGTLKQGDNQFNQYKGTDEDEDEYSEVQSEKNQEQRDQDMLEKLEDITYKYQKKDQYNPLQIPPDWVFAKKHAMSRATAMPKKQSKSQFCPCCGFVVNRLPLKFSIDTQQLNFLGSGYPLFYNFIIYCIFILFVLFMVSGGYNLFTNYLGSFCIADEQELDSVFKKRMEILGYKFEEEETICHKNIFHTFSLANKKDKPEFLKIQNYLNLFVCITMMIILMFFRRNQRQIDMEIDASLATPQDYTILVKNIPKGLIGIDYKKELTNIFKNHCCPGKVLEVENINLIYDINEMIEKEHQLQHTIQKKQEFLKKQGGFQSCDKHEIEKINEEIEKIEEKIDELEKEIPKDPSKFAGIAFISFSTEQFKKDCLKENTSDYWEQIQVWWNKGKKFRPTERDLMWGKNKLFVEEAPEPDDIDWEFIHIPTKDKFICRFYWLLVRVVFMAISFIAISALAKFQSHLVEYAYEEIQKGEMDSTVFGYIKSLSFIISAIIVLFNKFVLAEVFHRIADSEKWSTKTKLNISFADSLSLGLFLNSAVITYVVEIIHYKNYYGPGGFIYTESWVFLWNAVLPPLVWLINPYQMYKVSQRKKQLQLAKQKMCFLTQQEANNLMEDYDYIQGKRYADIMKTMWFTFLYAPCIPLGNFFSMFNLVAYYYIDKYNILRRSTVKENLSKQVPLQMTENLEYIIVFFALGNVTFSIHLFNTVEWSSIIQLILGLAYAILPMQDLNEYLFHIEDLDEEITYQEAKQQFKTDYDRLNPITKKDTLHKLVNVFQKNVDKIKNLNKLRLI